LVGHQTNQQFRCSASATLLALWLLASFATALLGSNLKKLLRTVEALADLGPELTADRDFRQTTRTILSAVIEAAGAREAVLFAFGERPSMLTSLDTQGFALIPDPAIIHLLPRHIHMLSAATGAIALNSANVDAYLSSNGNVAPELFRCICALKVRGKLVGAIALGRPSGDGTYDEDALAALEMIGSYVALAIQNHTLSQTLAQRVAENLRLLASLHGFYDNALEAFATAIDVKHVNIHGHSLRVGRYAQAIGEALGMEPGEVAPLRSAGYLHDIGKVAVDTRLFAKPSSLDDEESRLMRDHTTVGHQIVSHVQFPWPQIPEIVRWHHERSDGSGYPDGLHGEEMPRAVRIIALADAFDAMTTERPYRPRLSVGTALQELIRMAPEKYDPQVLQALLIQVRRDAVGSNRLPVLDPAVVNLSPGDIDALASTLQHRITQARVYLT